MTMNDSQLEALRAYMRVIEKNIAKRVDISLMEHFARMLISKLRDQPLEAETYRAAVEEVIASLPPEYEDSVIHVAREFYPFLMHDAKSVAVQIRSGGYSGFAKTGAVFDDKDVTSMSDLISLSEEIRYPERQQASHAKYLSCLESLSMEENIVAVRGRIARVLLYLLRDTPFSPAQYRNAINRVMPILNSEEARLYFVMVAREFFYFLTEDPGAPGKINVSENIK